MFSLTYSKPCPIQGHLKFKRSPMYYGIGIYEDVNGVKWDIWGIIRDVVLARPVDNCPIYSTDTDSILAGYSISYKPYTYEPMKLN
jgi:hypothetical protein